MAHQGPLLKAGEIVRNREEGWEGVVIRQRLDEDIYLVLREPLYYKAVNLEKVEDSNISTELRKLAEQFSSQTE